MEKYQTQIDNKLYQVVVINGNSFNIPEPAATILAEAFIKIRKEESNEPTETPTTTTGKEGV